MKARNSRAKKAKAWAKQRKAKEHKGKEGTARQSKQKHGQSQAKQGKARDSKTATGILPAPALYCCTHRSFCLGGLVSFSGSVRDLAYLPRSIEFTCGSAAGRQLDKLASSSSISNHDQHSVDKVSSEVCRTRRRVPARIRNVWHA